jgi:hypothetical protein
MSVTPLQASQNSGSGKPRYGPPDAPLDSCPLVFARVRYTYEDRDPLTFSSFLGSTATCWLRSIPPQGFEHAATPAWAGAHASL